MNSPHRFPYRWHMGDLDSTPPAQGAPTVFGTFLCGGGSTMGYKLAGFDHLGGVEIDPKVADIYRRNHHPRHLYIEDLRDFNRREDLPPELFTLDVLDGSPPCSTFSLSGDRERAWGVKKTFREGQARQTLDDLVFVYCETIAKLRPKVAILENVAGLVKGNARAYCHEIILRLDAAGYQVQVFLLNAAKMGVPQTRQRVFFIARRKDLSLTPLSISVHEPPIEFGKIIDRSDDTQKMSEREFAIWLKRKPADVKFSDILKRTERRSSRFNTMLLRTGRVAPTMTATDTAFLFDFPRKPSRIERLLLSSFPVDYDAPDSMLPFLTGMSVAPVQMAHIATAIKDQWLCKK